MSNRRAISTLETVIVISVICSGFVLIMANFGNRIAKPFEQTAQTLGHSVAVVSSNDHVIEPTTTGPVRPFSQSATFGALALIVIAFGYMHYKPVGNSASVKGTILNQLQKQIQTRNSAQSARLLEKRERIFRAFSGDSRSLLHNEIVAGDIMSISPSFISPNTPKHLIVKQMRSADLHHLLVCDSSGNLTGIISDRDLGKKNCVNATEMMTANPYTIQVDSEISEAISLMLVNRISCVPVLDGKILVGVISTSDIAVTLQCTLSLLNSLFTSEAKKERVARSQREVVSA